MRRTLFRLVPAAALLLAALPASAGTRTSAFADVDPGVRATGMGGAYSAVGGDPIALYWNPATVFYQRGRTLEASYADLYGLGLAKRSYISYGFKTTIDMPRMEGNKLTVRTDTETGAAYAFSAQSLFVDVAENGYSELSVGGAAGWGYGDRLAVGLAFRGLFVTSDLDDVSAVGYNLGLGVSYELTGRSKLALSAPHLLSRLSWKFDTSERLPFNAVLGYSRTFGTFLLVAADVELREGEDSPYRIAVGGELTLLDQHLVLRGGYRRLAGGIESITTPSAGVGVRVDRLQIDYAFRLEPEALGDTHRVGLAVRF